MRQASVFAIFLISFSGFGVSDEPAPSRKISFSGYEWMVKNTMPGQWGPGPNFFSDSEENVQVDDEGRLRLKIVKTASGQWTCAEIISVESFGHGTYRFVLSQFDEELDDNVVLGLFTWETLAEANNREIDVEISRWGDATDPENAQFVVQPYQSRGNLKRFSAPITEQSTEFSFLWSSQMIDFSCEALGETWFRWRYQGADLPQTGEEKVRLNLWLFQGAAPVSDEAVEVIVESFDFTAFAE